MIRCQAFFIATGTTAPFEEIGVASGFALADDGHVQASMGIAIGDYNRDGKVDFYVSSFSDDYNSLYRNEGAGNFSEVAYRAGLGYPTIPFLSWGTGFLDFDNDGLLDIFVANGHVYPGVDQQDWGISYAERPQLFRNLDGSKFKEVPRQPEAVWPMSSMPAARLWETYSMMATSTS